MLGPKGLKRCWMLKKKYYTSNLIVKGGVVLLFPVLKATGDEDDYPGSIAVTDA